MGASADNGGDMGLRPAKRYPTLFVDNLRYARRRYRGTDAVRRRLSCVESLERTRQRLAAAMSDRANHALGTCLLRVQRAIALCQPSASTRLAQSTNNVFTSGQSDICRRWLASCHSGRQRRCRWRLRLG
jgi:hypothetical protein